MGEKSQFVPGDKAPNDGEYMEIGENAFHMGINDPQIIKLKKGTLSPKHPIITASGSASTGAKNDEILYLVMYVDRNYSLPYALGRT